MEVRAGCPALGICHRREGSHPACRSDRRTYNVPANAFHDASPAQTLIAAVLPLLAGGAALAWYNWARFGSIFEFGIRYQLANVDYTQFKGSFGLPIYCRSLKSIFCIRSIFKAGILFFQWWNIQLQMTGSRACFILRPLSSSYFYRSIVWCFE